MERRPGTLFNFVRYAVEAVINISTIKFSRFLFKICSEIVIIRIKNKIKTNSLFINEFPLVYLLIIHRKGRNKEIYL